MNNKVNQDALLLEYLYILYPQKSKKDIKNLLTHQMVSVNGVVQTKYNYELHVGDKISVGKAKNKTSLDILYEDQDLIVINKPSGLLSMSTEREKIKTAYHEVSEYLKKQSKNNRVFIVHRLDQDTSGVLIFAKNEKIKHLLQNSWNDLVKVRGYLAIVEGKVEPKQKTIRSYLKESRTQMVYSTKNDGKLAITHYKVMKTTEKYSLLEVRLDTGRKNQIRVHMHDIKHSIVGDTKYGASSNPIRRLGLHSDKVEVKHPITHQILKFYAPMPESFKQLMKL